MDDEADSGGAERAFEALRAEVATLRQTVEGQAAPDYALTLGAIATELQAVGARLTAIEASPQLQATPADVALQIRQEAVRLAEGQVAQALAAREGFERGRETLGRVAFLEQRAQHDRRIVWAIGGGAALVGAVLGTMLFMEANRHAPDDWGWSAGLGRLADAGRHPPGGIQADWPKRPKRHSGGERGYPARQRLCQRVAQMRGDGSASRQGTAMHFWGATVAAAGEWAACGAVVSSGAWLAPGMESSGLLSRLIG
jgi:hypothetical protein